MRAANSNLSVVLVMAVGAAATWLWLNRGPQPAPHPTTLARPQPAAARAPTRREPERTAEDSTAGSVTVARATTPVPHADATYQSMLAFAHTQPFDPTEELRKDWPGGLPLRRQLLINQPIGDHVGILITYGREDPPATTP